MLSDCLKCRKNTESEKPKIKKIKNGTIMLSWNCAVCVSKKLRFIREQEASWLLRLLSSLRIKTPISSRIGFFFVLRV